MARLNSNAQSHKPCDKPPGHIVDAVTSSPCSFDVPSSSPRTYHIIQLKKSQSPTRELEHMQTLCQKSYQAT